MSGGTDGSEWGDGAQQKLERGSLAGVSPAVLEAVARALQPDDAEHAHLLNPAQTADGSEILMRPRRRTTRSWSRWRAHDVRHHGTGTKRFHHHAVGGLTLACESLLMAAEPDLTLTIHTAEPASPSEGDLRLPDSWAASREAELPSHQPAD